MRTAIAIFMGIISGFLIYMMAAMVTVSPTGRGPSPGLVIFTFFGGSALSIWLLRRGARSASKVAARGFLLGAAEWMLMILVGLIFTGRVASEAVSRSGGSAGATAGAALGGGLVAFMTGGVSFFMIVLCLAGFAISYFIGREMVDKTALPSRKCPECAEMVQAEARKCKHCGAALVPQSQRA